MEITKMETPGQGKIRMVMDSVGITSSIPFIKRGIKEDAGFNVI